MQLDRARAAVIELVKAPLSFPCIGALRAILAEPSDGSIDLDLRHDLGVLVAGCDSAVRALERMKIRSARAA